MSTTSILYTFDELMTSGIVVMQDGKEVRRKVERILIPMIQRPYAQGRKSQKGIRDNFLMDIFAALENKEVGKLELNFVYGTFTGSESGCFELLDGQQRLTTLFLLHWYIAKRERLYGSMAALPEYLDKFEYQTRTTSTLFLRKLYNARIAADELPSRTLRKATWYSKSFDKDSTIDSMLRMLDAIHKKYNEAAVKPTYQDLEKLKFYVLELNGFGLSEELFIKMNARGLQLTPFENFKADLVGYMKPLYTEQVTMTLSNLGRSVPCWLNFSSLIDGKWTNLFWERQTDSLKHFCNFSGSNIVLYSQAALAGGARLKLTFLEYGSLCIDVFGADKAKELFDAYCKMYGTTNIHDRNGKDIADTNGSLNFYKENDENCYRVNFIADASSSMDNINQLCKLMDEACNVLQ